MTGLQEDILELINSEEVDFDGRVEPVYYRKFILKRGNNVAADRAIIQRIRDKPDSWKQYNIRIVKPQDNDDPHYGHLVMSHAKARRLSPHIIDPFRYDTPYMRNKEVFVFYSDNENAIGSIPENWHIYAKEHYSMQSLRREGIMGTFINYQRGKVVPMKVNPPSVFFGVLAREEKFREQLLRRSDLIVEGLIAVMNSDSYIGWEWHGREHKDRHGNPMCKEAYDRFHETVKPHIVSWLEVILSEK